VRLKKMTERVASIHEKDLLTGRGLGGEKERGDIGKKRGKKQLRDSGGGGGGKHREVVGCQNKKGKPYFSQAGVGWAWRGKKKGGFTGTPVGRKTREGEKKNMCGMKKGKWRS